MSSILENLLHGKQLDRIEGMLIKLSSQEQELDQDIQAEADKLSALATAVNNLIAAIPEGVDLSDEIAAVKAAMDTTDTIETTVEGATPSSPSPSA